MDGSVIAPLRMPIVLKVVGFITIIYGVISVALGWGLSGATTGIVCLVLGIGVLKRAKWAWYLALCANAVSLCLISGMFVFICLMQARQDVVSKLGRTLFSIIVAMFVVEGLFNVFVLYYFSRRPIRLLFNIGSTRQA
jgi:hypothetical protein